MGCCGQKSGTKLEYQVTLGDGSKHTVSSMAEARLKINTSPHGGTYMAVPVPKKA